ncbi:MAG: class I fructose-bisphosphate aldolase [Chloroflexota bacterium]
MGGRETRLARIFQPDGRTVIVAMDHAAPMGPLPGLEDPARTIRDVVAGGADAVLTTWGTATRFGDALQGRGLVLRLIEGQALDTTDAVRAGADAVLNMLYLGTEEAETNRHTGELARGAAEWEIPLGVEVLVRVPDATPAQRVELLRRGLRAAFELGADFIKTTYPGDPDSFARIAEGCPIPIVVLGGERTGTDEACLTTVHEAIAAGAAGVAIGRNVWQHPDPTAMTAALVRLVHDGARIDDVLDGLATPVR